MLPRGYTVIANETEVVAYCLYFPGNDELLDTEAFNWSAGHLQARQAHFHLMTPNECTSTLAESAQAQYIV